MGTRRTLISVAAVVAVAAAALVVARSCAPDDGKVSAPGARPPAETKRDVRAPRIRPQQPAETAPDAPAAAEPPTPSPATKDVPKLRIWGRVVDDLGRVVEGAEVEVRAWSGKDFDVKTTTLQTASRVDGAFEVIVDRDRASDGFGLATSKDGHVEGWRAVKAAEYDETQGADVTAERARAVTGRILDGAGKPIAGTTVQLWYGAETTWPSEPDAQGRFRTPARGPRRALELVVEAPGYPTRRIELKAADEELTDAGEIIFRRGLRVAGVVVDNKGNAVADLGLVLGNVAGGWQNAPRTRTDGAGRFEFTDVAEGEVGVGVDVEQSQGGATGAKRKYRGGLGDIKAGRTDVRLVVGAETTLWLRFVDADTRKPVDVQSAKYGVRAAGTPEPETPPHGASGSDPLLSASMTVLAGERYDVTVRSPGFDDAHVDNVEVGDAAEQTVDVPMRRTR